MRIFFYYIFHVLVLAYSLLLIYFSVLPVKAQPQEITAYRLEDLDSRTKAIESLSMRLDQRLTIIETTLRNVESGTSWNQLTMGGIGLLIARAVYQELMSRHRRKED